MIMYILYKYLPLVGLVINDHVSIVEVSPPGRIKDQCIYCSAHILGCGKIHPTRL